MSTELVRALLLADAVTADGVARALFASLGEDRPVERTLVTTGAVDERRLQDELARWDGPSIQNVVPVLALVERLPRGMCSRLLALPVRIDPRTGTVDVAVADGADPHPPAEIRHFLRAPVRAVRASLTALVAAVSKLDATERAPSGPPIQAPPPAAREVLVPKETPLWGTPLVGLGAPRPVSDLPIPLTRRAREEPDTDRDPQPAFELVRSERFRPPRLPLPDLGPVLASLRAASDRDAVMSIVLSGVRGVAGRVAVLVRKHDVFVGWSCTPEFGSAGALRNVHIPADAPSVLSRAAAGGMYLGPLFESAAHEPLRAVMGSASDDLAVCAVKVAGRIAMLVVADDLADTALSTKHMDAIATAAGEALARLVRRRAT